MTSDLEYNNQAIISMIDNEEMSSPIHNNPPTIYNQLTEIEDHQDDLFDEASCQNSRNAEILEGIAEEFDSTVLFKGHDSFMADDDEVQDASSLVPSPIGSRCSTNSSDSCSSCSRSESRFDQSSFVTKQKRRKQPAIVPVPSTATPVIPFNRLSGRGTYLKLVNNQNNSPTIRFTVYSKPSDGRGTRLDPHTLTSRGEVSVMCAINNPTGTCYLNMKLPDNKKKSVFDLVTIKQRLSILGKPEIWIQFPGSNVFFNIYCQKGKGSNLVVHNLINFEDDQVISTEEVETLKSLSSKSVTPSTVTYFSFNN